MEHVEQPIVVDRLGEQRQVVAQRRMEELDVLADHPHPLPQVDGIGVGQGDPTHSHRPLVGVIQPRDQTGDGGLPAAGAPQDAEDDLLPDLE